MTFHPDNPFKDICDRKGLWPDASEAERLKAFLAFKIDYTDYDRVLMEIPYPVPSYREGYSPDKEGKEPDSLDHRLTVAFKKDELEEAVVIAHQHGYELPHFQLALKKVARNEFEPVADQLKFLLKFGYYALIGVFGFLTAMDFQFERINEVRQKKWGEDPTASVKLDGDSVPWHKLKSPESQDRQCVIHGSLPTTLGDKPATIFCMQDASSPPNEAPAWSSTCTASVSRWHLFDHENWQALYGVNKININCEPIDIADSKNLPTILKPIQAWRALSGAPVTEAALRAEYAARIEAQQQAGRERNEAETAYKLAEEGHDLRRQQIATCLTTPSASLCTKSPSKEPPRF